MYVIEYDIKDKEREKVFLSDLKELGESNLFLPNTFFLDSREQRDSVYEKLRSHLAPEDLLFIVETNLSMMSGWLTKSSVDWIQHHK